jgi:predicted unusual protein kinase regulating ubiquinone biosynthesis (AarF/ABC1/UbiB family)
MARKRGEAGDKDDGAGEKAVPTGRVGRFARVARLAGGVAGGMLAEGTRQLRAGKRLKTRDMLLTPANARRVGDQLAEMRGAAMKIGQILSMDTGDLLPRELADILARLRSDARAMPIGQLRTALTEAYGDDWETLLYGFDFSPLAAASIGQVHRAYSPDGREIVLKVQYPGVARTIDSDVDNIATLLRVSGLLPTQMEIRPLLEDAKAQLRDEADYLKEAKFLQSFGEMLADDDRFLVPEVLPELTHRNVLAMTYLKGSPIESVADCTQDERDRVMSALIELMLMELFELRLVQTDPNFANYQYRKPTGEIILLDFGATRRFKVAFVNNYRRLAAAAEAQDSKKVALAAERLGYAIGEADSQYRDLVMELFLLALEPLRQDAPYDFARSTMPARMSELGRRITDFRDFWQAPPTDAVYFHRKLGGMFMLASRVGARVNVYQLMRRWLD